MADMVYSYWLALIFQISHVVSEVGVVIITNRHTSARYS